MTGRRGGGRSAGHEARIAGLETDVVVARGRLDFALAEYHKLRY
jgi:hypothetical protein